MLSDRCLYCLSVLSVTLVYCGQTAGWTKVPLGKEVGLDQATLQQLLSSCLCLSTVKILSLLEYLPAEIHWDVVSVEH